MSSLLSGLTETLNSALLTPEQQRQRRTGDSQYAAATTIIFEMRLPPALTGGTGTYLFPLRVPPQAISLSEPFAADVTATQRGGLFVEQSGIVQRRLRLRGTPGFWPTDLQANLPRTPLPGVEKSYSRQLPVPSSGDPLSGMRHAQSFQDWLRTYADLCRNPATVDQVRLIYHDMEQNEHFICIPMSFGTERSSASPFVSQYDVDLLLVDKADAPALLAPNPDTSLLGSLKDAYAATQNFLARANAAVRTLTATQADLSRTVHGVGATLGQVGTLIGAAADFVGGTLSFIRSPFQSISAIAAACEESCRLALNAERAGAALASWPFDVAIRFRQISTACEQLALSSAPFRRPSPRALSAGVQSSAEAPPAPTSFAALRALGSTAAATTGSLSLAPAVSAAGAPTGTLAHQVQQGDSLSSLAVHYLGAASQWGQIAAANAFSAPVVADAPAAAAVADGSFYGTVLRVGDTILIPAQAVASTADPAVPVVGANPEASAAEQTLGVDLALLPDARGQLDLVLGQTDGLPDLQPVRGLENMRQAALCRLNTERGTALLAPELGLERIVGSGQAEADLQQVQLRVTQALLADPRVQALEDLQLTQTNDSAGVSVTLRLLDASGQARLTLAA